MIFLRYFLLFSLVGAKKKNGMNHKYRTGSFPLNFPRNFWREDFSNLMWVEYDENVNVPENFDPRTVWPRCKSIGNIYNQGDCGWCWAISVASAVTDRWCIFVNGTDNFEYSPVDLLSCCDKCFSAFTGNYTDRYNRCESGAPYFGMEHIMQKGCVSVACKPFTSEITEDKIAPLCEDKCTDEDHNNRERRYLKASRLLLDEAVHEPNDYLKQLQIELMTNGPSIMGMYVSEHFIDFFIDEENVDKIYQGEHETTKNSSDHAIRLLGWGQENGIPYWLCANSWGRDWGNGGFFKILRGKNLLSIEDSFIVPYHNEPPQSKTEKQTTRRTIARQRYFSCAKTVTIQKIIIFFIVLIYV